MLKLKTESRVPPCKETVKWPIGVGSIWIKCQFLVLLRHQLLEGWDTCAEFGCPFGMCERMVAIDALLGDSCNNVVLIGSNLIGGTFTCPFTILYISTMYKMANMTLNSVLHFH